MKSSTIKLACCLTVLTLLILATNTAAANHDEQLILATNEFPPYSFYRDGRLAGIAVDLVNALVARTGYKGGTKLMPWRRAIEYAEDHPVVLFPFARMPYREKKYRWIGPIMVDSFVFGVRSSDKTPFTDLDDFKTIQIGAERSTPGAVRLALLGFEKIQTVSTDRFNAKKLIVGRRIDAWYSTHLIMQYTLEMAGINRNQLRIAYKDMDIEMYIGASLRVSGQTVAQWQKNLDEMKENGQYQQILYDSILGWKQP